MVLSVPLLRLQCGVNSYAWGKKGNDSAAARFAAATPTPDLTIEADRPYAELWMGSHPSNPSKHLATGLTLNDLFARNKALLSPQVASRYADRLPFLFKVLSVNKALSIQAHPNKALAEKLHARDPKNYPDDNHKPEMAIAITPFEGLCGFRPPTEVVHFLDTLPPLRALVGDEAAVELGRAAADGDDEGEGDVEATKKALKQAFANLMGSAQADVDREIANLVGLASSQGEGFVGGGVSSTSGADLARVVTRLHGEFGSDVGLFVLFFLNLVKLQPGEALFLVADDIHAYISGDIIECMAASDNVVRAGLTPKFKDTDTLVSMLTYNFAPIEQQKMEPSEYPYATLNRAAYSGGSSIDLYDPPIDEFSVVRSVIRGDAGAKATFEPLAGPSIIICTQGSGTISVGPTKEEIKGGYVFFVGATAECVLESTSGPDDEFVTYKAFCEIAEEGKL
ncbi:mannose-6-phosphate isomerase [Geosmithia morbida]|uniref:Mannose-6-phosphate isomerase n=1 Tax=Geosmithia morbida TaxID=1094350 RepID=A0A9P4YN90_9HYPO|nr:mannose-6-phosphate isomerase [Geosmithia morbida]KAF4120068.1 mannose-6-phosphate isomerase [Geosmithia morbida]